MIDVKFTYLTLLGLSDYGVRQKPLLYWLEHAKEPLYMTVRWKSVIEIYIRSKAA